MLLLHFKIYNFKHHFDFFCCVPFDFLKIEQICCAKMTKIFDCSCKKYSSLLVFFLSKTICCSKTNCRSLIFKQLKCKFNKKWNMWTSGWKVIQVQFWIAMQKLTPRIHAKNSLTIEFIVCIYNEFWDWDCFFFVAS